MSIREHLMDAFMQQTGRKSEAIRCADIAMQVIDRSNLVDASAIPPAELVVQGEGIEDGISRVELIRAAVEDDGEPRPGRETEVRYRGYDIELHEGFGDCIAVVYALGGPFGYFRLKDINEWTYVIQWVEAIDRLIDYLRQA